jgi:ELWxxDGT repeat protein
MFMKDVDVSGGIGPSEMFAFDGVIYFSAYDGVTANYLWKSDGTTSGTVMVSTDVTFAGLFWPAPQNLIHPL